jgi:hypothetical protein
VQLKHRLDELYTQHPFLGSRKIVKIVEILAAEGLAVGRHTIRRYRQEMGLATLYPQPKLSQPGGPEHKIYPYLLHLLHLLRGRSILRGLSIEHPNQPESGLGRRHHLGALGQRLDVAGGFSGLVFLLCGGLGVVRHLGDGLCAAVC